MYRVCPGEIILYKRWRGRELVQEDDSFRNPYEANGFDEKKDWP
jgi:hypothetical protein